MSIVFNTSMEEPKQFTCNKCNKIKDKYEFVKDKKCKYGIQYICKKFKSEGSSKNGESVWKYLPYTPKELRDHLERQFESWMNWGNHGNKPGDWNMDHIKAHSRFKYKLGDAEFLKCFALSNLRPLERLKNLRKGTKIILDLPIF